MSSAREPFRINADPNGDVNLVLSSSVIKVSLRASSKVLSLASPAFAALLSPRWYKVNDTPAPHEVTLPEDDPIAMYWICQALHYRPNLSTSLALPFVEKLAVLCDKYDLAVALKPWSGLFLQGETFYNRSDEKKMLKVMHIASVFDNHEQFYMASLNILCCCPAQDTLWEGGDCYAGQLHCIEAYGKRNPPDLGYFE